MNQKRISQTVTVLTIEFKFYLALDKLTLVAVIFRTVASIDNVGMGIKSGFKRKSKLL